MAVEIDHWMSTSWRLTGRLERHGPTTKSNSELWQIGHGAFSISLASIVRRCNCVESGHSQGRLLVRRGNGPMLPKTPKVFLAGLLSTAMAVAPCSAATVLNEGGSVLVSMGEGFEAISSPKELAPGGRVMVKSGGVAT